MLGARACRIEESNRPRSSTSNAGTRPVTASLSESQRLERWKSMTLKFLSERTPVIRVQDKNNATDQTDADTNQKICEDNCKNGSDEWYELRIPFLPQLIVTLQIG